MSKFSVKKPFTVLVGIIIAIVLGVVSLMKMQLDLLPEISLPYLVVLTTYPGASAEKIETEICVPMEAALGTINGVKNTYSVCNENYGMVELEFQDGTNIDSAMVKVSSAINTIESSLPDDAGTPSIIELSTDMMANVYLAIGMEGMEMDELSQFIRDDIQPQYEKQNGVASVTSRGMVEKTIQVELNQDKVDALNDKILATVDGAFAKAVDQLDDAKKQLNDSKKTIDKNRDKLIDSQKDLEESKQDLIDGQKELDENKTDYYKSLSDYEEGKEELEDNKKKMEDAESELKSKKSALNKTLAEKSLQMEQLQEQIDTARGQLSTLQQVKTNMDSEPDDDTAKGMAEAALGGTYADRNEANAAMEAAISAAQDGISEYENGYKALEEGKLTAAEELGSADAQLKIGKQQLDSADSQLESAQKQLDSAKKQIDKAQDQITDGWDSIADGQDQINEGWDSLRDGEKQLSDGWDDYNDAVKSYEKQRKEAEKKANADQLLTLDALTGLIYAQNFEMPAGYVDDKLDNSWLVKVGQNYEEVDELKDIVLTNIHNVGDVKLGDVADITIIDNSMDSYVRLGDKPAVVLSIFKSSTAGTNDVSEVVQATSDELMERFPGLEVVKLVDMGDYINIIVKSVLQSMIIGAILAIIILAIFLKDVKPTLVVA
ncbi:MAG: efflux RND transporter permease subunit, partial [Lachnospiraceae bacterium]|nr:efflux RND transporter permease subunit [Lachnospiraceae bacterium]